MVFVFHPIFYFLLLSFLFFVDSLIWWREPNQKNLFFDFLSKITFAILHS